MNLVLDVITVWRSQTLYQTATLGMACFVCFVCYVGLALPDYWIIVLNKFITASFHLALKGLYTQVSPLSCKGVKIIGERA